MTTDESAPVVVAGADHLTAILVAVTEIRGDVKTALAEVRRVDTTLTDHDRRLRLAEESITELKSHARADVAHAERNINARGAFWTAVSAIFIALTLLVSIIAYLIAHHH